VSHLSFALSNMTSATDFGITVDRIIKIPATVAQRTMQIFLQASVHFLRLVPGKSVEKLYKEIIVLIKARNCYFVRKTSHRSLFLIG